VSGFLSLWAIVDKEEIAAINGAAPQDTVLRKTAPVGPGQSWIIPPAFIGCMVKTRKRADRVRDVQVDHTRRVTRIKERITWGEPTRYTVQTYKSLSRIENYSYPTQPTTTNYPSTCYFEVSMP